MWPFHSEESQLDQCLPLYFTSCRPTSSSSEWSNMAYSEPLSQPTPAGDKTWKFLINSQEIDFRCVDSFDPPILYHGNNHFPHLLVIGTATLRGLCLFCNMNTSGNAIKEGAMGICHDGGVCFLEMLSANLRFAAGHRGQICSRGGNRGAK